MKHLYFGDGKGKTTAAVGIAVRAAGSNLKVLFVQFLKTEFSGERHVLSHTENVTLTLCPADLKFTFQMNEKEKAQAAKIFKGIFDHSVTLALTEKYDMVVFDEIIDAINAEMLTESEVVEFITNAPSSMEIIMTGHNPSQKMIDLCDYVTEFKKSSTPMTEASPAESVLNLILSLCRQFNLQKHKTLERSAYKIVSDTTRFMGGYFFALFYG